MLFCRFMGGLRFLWLRLCCSMERSAASAAAFRGGGLQVCEWSAAVELRYPGLCFD